MFEDLPAEIPRGISSQNYRRLKAGEIPCNLREVNRRERETEETTEGDDARLRGREVMRSVRPEAIERYNWPEATIPRRWSANRYDTIRWLNWFSKKFPFLHFFSILTILLILNTFSLENFQSNIVARFDQKIILSDYSIFRNNLDSRYLDWVAIVWHWIIITWYIYTKNPRIKKKKNLARANYSIKCYAQSYDRVYPRSKPFA